MTSEKWEYMTQYCWADVDNEGAKEYIKRQWPKFVPKKYSPETMIPALNRLGEDGWELVSMQPVVIGNNYDVGIVTGTGLTTWTNVYFCAFKRRIS